MMKFLMSFVAAISLALPGAAFAANWKIDPNHSAAQFSVSHLMVSKVRGEFGKMEGTVVYDAKKPQDIAIEATIDVTSINTRVKQRDDHLRNPDFFDVENHPTMTFKSKSAKKKGKDKLEVTGDLTIRGTTKEVVLAVQGLDKEIKDPWGNTVVGGVATTKINRKDFGVSYNAPLDGGGLMVGEEVDILIDFELIKQAEEKTAEK